MQRSATSLRWAVLPSSATRMTTRPRTTSRTRFAPMNHPSSLSASSTAGTSWRQVSSSTSCCPLDEQRPITTLMGSISASCRGGRRCDHHDHLLVHKLVQQQRHQIQRRPLSSWFPSFLSSSVFDPLKASSTTVLFKQADAELTPEERHLKQCLQSYQQQLEQQEQDDAVVDMTMVIYQDLQQAYEQLEYWEEALGMEELKHAALLEEEENNDNDSSMNDDLADSLHQQGKYHLRLSNFAKSKELYDQALEYFTNAQNPIQQGHVLMSLAGWHFFRNDNLQTAMDHLKEAEFLLETNPTLLFKCLDNQGLIHRLQADYEQALQCYQEALQLLLSETTATDSIATTASSILKNRKRTSRDDASTQQRHALEMHIGDMLLALQRHSDALLVYQRLLEEVASTPTASMEETEKNRGVQGVLHHQIATIHVEQAQYELAEEEFQQALLLFKQQGQGRPSGQHQQTTMEYNPEVAKTWNALGILQATALNKKELALESFRNVLWIARIHANSDGKNDNDDPNVLQAIQRITQVEQEILQEQQEQQQQQEQ